MLILRVMRSPSFRDLIGIYKYWSLVFEEHTGPGIRVGAEAEMVDEGWEVKAVELCLRECGGVLSAGWREECGWGNNKVD